MSTPPERSTPRRRRVDLLARNESGRLRIRGMWRVQRHGWDVLVNVVGASMVLRPSLRRLVYRLGGIDVDRSALVSGGQFFRPGRVTIGANTFVNVRCLFDPGAASIAIEQECSLGPEVVLQADDHRVGGSGRRAGENCSRPIVIGAGTWLGARVTVLPGVRIAPGCLVGAGAVVASDTEPDGLYIGVPARLVRRLGPGDQRVAVDQPT